MTLHEWVIPAGIGVVICGVGLYIIQLALTGDQEELGPPVGWELLVDIEQTAVRRALWFVIGLVSLASGGVLLLSLVIAAPS